MTLEEKKETQEYAEERYLSYIFLRKSGNQHNKLKNRSRKWLYYRQR